MSFSLLVSLILGFTISVQSKSSCPSNLVQPPGENGTKGLLRLQNGSKPVRLADPYVERTSDGRVRVYGTSNDEYLEYANENAFLFGSSPVRHKVEFHHPNGKKLNPDEMPWDLIPLQCPGESRPVYMAGVMTPPEGKTHAKWPDDNSGRRTYVFKESPTEPGKIIRSEKPLFSDTPAREWVGHNYGRDFIRDERGEPLKNADGSYTLVYERVTRKTWRGKLVTELASRSIKCPSLETGPEKILMKIDDRSPYPAAKREDGGLLLEGPRVMRAEGKNGEPVYVMGFSSGDFPTDRYGINLASSSSPNGPFKPVLDSHGKDLKDFAKDIRAKYNLSWGPARPAFFTDNSGQQWIVFHAVDKTEHPGVDFSKWPKDLAPFQRGVYMVPFKMKTNERNEPTFEISEFICEDKAKPNGSTSPKQKAIK